MPVVTMAVTTHLAGRANIQESEAYTATIVESSLDGIVTIDDLGRIIEFNPAAERMFGHARAGVLGKDLTETIIPPALHDQHRHGLAHTVATGDGPLLNRRVEVMALRADGSEFPVELAIVPIRLGGRCCFTGFLRDLTEHKAAEGALRAAEDRYRTLVEQVPGVIYVEAVEGAVNPYMSPQVEALIGFTPAEIQATPGLWRGRVHPDDQARVVAELRRTDETGDPYRMEYRALTRDGRVVWLRNEAVLVRDAANASLFWHGLITDITDRKMLEERLAHQAFHDPLTGLPNRALFFDRLEHALARSARARTSVAVLFLDLDSFKVVNDTLGHAAGDRLLVAVATRLAETLRPGDTLARLGGDEFTILLEDLSGVEAAHPISERVASDLRAPFQLCGREVLITASVGLATLTAETRIDDLVRLADLAMYEAKARGKDRVAVFDVGMDVRAWQRLDQEAELRRAIADGQLCIHYQPLVALTDGQITGVEALVRWEHPERGLVSPAEFLPMAEETGLIVPLSRWVLETACARARSWQREFPSEPRLGISVNFSGCQFRDPGLVGDVERALARSGLAASDLTLEVTETPALEDKVETKAALRGLKALGVRLAIDDFGEGCAGLGSLSRCPIDEIKIDRAYVDGLGRSPAEAALVRAVVVYAQALGIVVTAEGIETAGQLAAVRALGCVRGQGFYFARPMTAEEMTVLLGEKPEWRAFAGSDGPLAVSDGPLPAGGPHH